MYVWMDGWMDVCMMDGWMDGWMGGWMDGWMDVYIYIYIMIYIYTVYIRVPTYSTYHPRNSDPMTPGRHDRQRAPLLLPLAQRDKTDNYLLLLSREWREWGNGIKINSYCGSFPHSLLSTSKINRYYPG